jgi:hypothetical protein
MPHLGKPQRHRPSRVGLPVKRPAGAPGLRPLFERRRVHQAQHLLTRDGLSSERAMDGPVQQPEVEDGDAPKDLDHVSEHRLALVHPAVGGQ